MRFRIIELLHLLYRLGISPALHLFLGPTAGCRFEPSCSQYAREAFHTHPLLYSSFLVIRRISRCHPFGQAGYDPIPRAIGTKYRSPYFNHISASGR